MSFSDHKIASFTHKIADLPDQPNLPADELKARFDSSPEELRTAHNAVCDDVQTLSDKVDNIITETFDGVIEKSMLSGSLAAELDAKAVESSVASRIAAEQTARESGDSALSTRVTTLESKVPQKCEAYAGTYTGNGAESQVISLGFKPKAVFAVAHGTEFREGYLRQGALAVQGSKAGPYGYTALEVVSNGFRAYYNTDVSSYRMMLNTDGVTYHYIALK